jgi:hypothetical protein
VALRTRSRRSTVLVAIGAVAATLVIGYLIWGGSDDDGTEVAASASDDRPINRANKNKNEGEDEDKDEGKAEDKAATNGDDGKAEPAEDGPESGDNTASDDEPETGDGEPADTGDPVDGDGSGDGSGNNGDEPATDPAGEEKTPTTAPIAAGECAIEVTSKPAGAAILLGRKKLGVTPSTVSVACDTTELTLKRSRYALAKTKIAPTSGQTARVEVRLQRPTFALRVSSRPKATLYVGGRRVGSTPRTVKIRGYERTKVKLARKGYKTWSKRIYVKKKRYSLRVRLKRKR